MKGKKVLIAVTGSIAAYKSVLLLRNLQKAGAEVKVVMTPAATDFVSPLTFSTLSKHPVYSEVSSEEGWNNHVELGLWADLMIIAPCTANTLSSFATGTVTNVVHAVYLSAKCPILIAPAMDRDMWKHPSTQENLKILRSYGNTISEVESGYLASGLIGEGRMAEPDVIAQQASDIIYHNKSLKGKRFLISAGPTQESIDPVRFISNHSSGKMGIRIADEAANRGAEVTLVLGPTHLRPEEDTVHTVHVQSAQDMYEACLEHFTDTDVAVMAAAVADYTPATTSHIKIKKSDDDMSIALERTQDIAAYLGKNKKEHQVLIGFALETNNALENAKGKLKRKNLDMIILNTLQDKGAGFKGDTNKVTIIESDVAPTDYPLKSKREVAVDILNYLEKNILKIQD